MRLCGKAERECAVAFRGAADGDEGAGFRSGLRQVGTKVRGFVPVCVKSGRRCGVSFRFAAGGNEVRRVGPGGTAFLAEGASVRSDLRQGGRKVRRFVPAWRTRVRVCGKAERRCGVSFRFGEKRREGASRRWGLRERAREVRGVVPGWGRLERSCGVSLGFGHAGTNVRRLVPACVRSERSCVVSFRFARARRKLRRFSQPCARSAVPRAARNGLRMPSPPSPLSLGSLR